jgi:hypothetical protein
MAQASIANSRFLEPVQVRAAQSDGCHAQKGFTGGRGRKRLFVQSQVANTM